MKDLGNVKKDQLYLVLSGLNLVDFGSLDKVTCLQSVQAGTKHVENDADAQVNWAPCAAWDKDLGWV